MARRGRSRRRGRKRKNDLWIVGALAVAVAGYMVVQVVQAYPGWAAATAAVLVVGVVGGLVWRARAIQAERRRFLAANSELAKVDRLTGDQFELLIVERLRADGFRQVVKRGGSGDLGVDITAVAAGHGRYAVQCKRYRGTIGAPQVRNFLGTLANTFDGYTGILVTSGRLTRQAKSEALTARQPLIIVERDRLADWLLGTVTLLPSGAPEMPAQGELA